MAAGQQDQYYEFLNLAFTLGNLDEESFLNGTALSQIDRERFRRDLSSEECQQLVADDVLISRSSGVTATPTFLIGNARFAVRVGGYDKDLPKIIDDFLSAARKYGD